VKELTDGRGADIVVEVVGLAAATVEGLDMVRVNGTYVDIGNIVPQTVTLPATKIISQQIRWLGLMHYNPWIIPAALDLLVRTKDKYPQYERRVSDPAIRQLAAPGGTGGGRSAEPWLLRVAGDGRPDLVAPCEWR